MPPEVPHDAGQRASIPPLEAAGRELDAHAATGDDDLIAGLERRDVIEKCMELGVPIFQGRIDKTLFLASLREEQTAEEPIKV